MPHKDAERRKEYQRAYQKEWRKRKGEEYREWNRKRMIVWNKENYPRIYEIRRSRPYEKLAASIRTRIQGAVKMGYKSASTEKLLGCRPKELRNHLQKQFQDGMTWENYGFYGWHIDHKIPLANFNLIKEEEQKKAFHYTNLQPLWAKENIRKGAKLNYQK